MSDVYLIKKETLTNIRDAIWNNSADVWVGEFMTPEQMSDAIYDVYDEGYSYGYDDGYSEGKKITDLTGTSIEIRQDWYVEAGYGEFDIDCIVVNLLYGGYYEDVYRIKFGCDAYDKPSINKIKFYQSGGSFVISTNFPFGLKIKGGLDATNPNLIDWLHRYGTLKSYADVRDEGYTEGYGIGYENGVIDTFDIAYEETYVPLMIQGLMNEQRDEMDMFPPSVYTQDLCGKSYSLSSFIEEEVVASSTTFTMSVINNTDCCVDLYCRAVCNTDLGSEQEEFWLTVDGQSDNSYETYLGLAAQQHDWTYEILGVIFYYV